MKQRNRVCMWIALCAFGAFAQLPSEWMDVPFGNYTAAYEGGSTYDAGTFTVVGSGINMWNATDDGGRFVFQPMLGDCQVIANVQHPTNSSLPYSARAGVLIQQQNDRGSLHMLFAWMRGDASNVGRITASGRLTLGATPTSKSENGHLEDWMLMRLIRQGDTVRAYLNTNSAWELYHTLTVPMGEAVNAGIFVSRNTTGNALITNEFDTVTAQQLVTVQANATGGLDVSWVTDLPGIDAAWAAGYTYRVTRTPIGGAAEVVAQDQASANWTDSTAVTGTVYRYSVTAVPVADEPLVPPAESLIGTSGSVRLPYADTNLMTGLDQGLFAAYYSPTDAVAAVESGVVESVTNATVVSPGGSTNYFGAVFNANIQVDATDLYTFFIESDDGLHLWAGDELIINNWYGNDYKASSRPVWLEAGRTYPMKVEYYQNTAGRVCTLAWRRVGEPDVTVDVPASAFTPVPLPWRHEDIGGVTLNGNADFDLGTGAITVTSAGNALTNGSDACHLVSRDVSGDFDLKVRLDSLTGDGADRRAGVALRAGLTPGAVGVALVAVPGATEYDVVMLSRGAADVSPTVTSAASGVATGGALWLRLTRTGLAVTAQYSADGTTWTAVWSGTGLTALNAKACLLASSADASGAAEAVFGVVEESDVPSSALLPTDDTYVRSDNINYGATTDLVCKRREGDVHRETFLRYDLAGLSDVHSAVLRLYVQARPTASLQMPLVIQAFRDLSWDEASATWANVPGNLRLPSGFIAPEDPTFVARMMTPQVGEYLEVDVTAFALAAVAGSGDLTFHIYSLVPNDTTISFGSKENTVADRRPVLILSYETPQHVKTDSGPAVGEVTVQWDAFLNATAYRVYRADTVDGTYTQTGADTSDTRFKDTGLTGGQTYFYKVSGITAEGETPLSAAVSGTAAASVETLAADEDAYVEGDGGTRQSANTVFNGTVLTIKYNATALDFHREAYLLFNDITGLAHVARAVLKVVPTTASPGDPATIPVQFIRMPSNDWSETTVTFNNHPGGYPPPTPRLTSEPESDRVTVPAQAVGMTMAVDVTEIVRKAARVNADNKLSIGVIRLDNTGTFNLSLASSENGTTAYRPKLELTMGRPMTPDLSSTNGYIELSWPPYRGATGYVVRRAATPEGPFTALTNTTNTAFKDLAPGEGQAFCYTLAAVTAAGETEASEPVFGRPEASEARSPVADAYIESNSGLTTTTNHGTDPELNLKVSPCREDFFKFDVTGLENVERARFRVSARSPNGNFTSSTFVMFAGDFGNWNEMGVTYADPPPNYTPPTVTTAEKGSNELGRITFEVEDNDGSYNSYMEADATEAVRAAAQAGKRYLTIQITGDASTWGNDGAAYLSVRAKEFSTASKRPVLLCSGSPFGAPPGLRAEPQPDLPGMTLVWRAVVGADHYIILRLGPQDEAPVVVAGNVTGTRFTDSDPAFWNDRDYTYTVIAVAADGTQSSAASVTQSLTRSFTAPALADTFVRAGDYTNASYALSSVVEIKGDGDMNYQREGFFRFAVSNLPEIVNAQLRLRLKGVNTFTAINIALFETNDTGWVESGDPVPTWNSILGEGAGRTAVPGVPELIASFNLDASGYLPGDDMFFDITPQFIAARDRAAETVMVQMVITTLNGQGNISVQSLQGPDLDAVPTVIYTVANRPSPGTLILLK